jgi:dTDP-4-dehydrorhamnose reductase
VILRTSWVYAARGRNFLLTMLRLAGEGRPLRVVNDQAGAPTWSRDIAQATTQVVAKVEKDARATYHLAAAGKTTWYGFARRIFEMRGVSASIAAIRSEEFPTAAARPKNSVLDCGKLRRELGISIPGWERGLGLALAELR